MKKVKVERINETLFESAKSLGMCRDGVNEWPQCKGLEQLCEHYFEGIEFIINHPGWPSDEWLVDTIGKKNLEANGIFINASVNINIPGHAVFNGTCDGKVLCDGFSAPELYIRGNSSIELTASDGAIVHVSTYDNAKLTVKCGQFATVYVYKYGGTVKNTEGDGKIVVRDRTNS